MKRRLLHLVVALMAFAATTMAQSLSVAPIEATLGTETTITVNIAGAAEMTALQCNLQLPEGLTLAGDITLGDAAKGHTLSTSTLASGDLLIVLYDLYQSTFTDGTLITIPVVAAEEPSTTEGTLHKVRTSTIAAQSKALSDVKFTAVVEEEEPEGLLAGKNYRVKNVTTGLYLQVEGNNTNMKLQNKAEGVALTQVFQLEEAAEGKYYIKAADSDNNYYAHASGWNFNATTNADNKTPFTIALVEGETQVYTLHQSVSAYTGLAGADDATAGAAIYCNKGIDNNGKWAFEPLTEEENAAYVAALTAGVLAELQAVIDAAEAAIQHAGTEVGALLASATDALAIAVAAAREITAENAYSDIVAAVEALRKAIQAAYEAGIVYPQEGKFYTIANAHTDARGGQKMYVNEDGGMQFSAADAHNNLFQFVSAGEGKFYLYNVLNGVYLSTAKGHAGGQNQTLATAAEKAKAVTIASMGKDNQVKIVPEGGAMLHAQAHGSEVVGWDADNADDASAWRISEVAFSLTDLSHTLTVSEAGWATLVLGYNTEIPADVTVYAVSEAKEGYATLAEVADVLPAHTPVLVEAAAGKYAFNYTDETAAVENNLLEGSVFNVTVSEAAYILGNGAQGVGLYKAKFDVSTDKTNDGTEEAPAVTYEAFVNHANKAYLPAPAGASAAMFSFGHGEGTTSIENSKLEIENSTVIYDLLGRRVQNMAKGGIYIVNGKKVIK